MNSKMKEYMTSNYLALNWKFIRIFGLKNAAFLANLIDHYHYLEKQNLLDEEKWFFYLNEYQAARINCTEDALQKCKKFFLEIGILETKIMQNPNGKGTKEFFRLDEDKLTEIVEIMGTAPGTGNPGGGNPENCPPGTGNPGGGNLFKTKLNIKSFSKEKPKSAQVHGKTTRLSPTQVILMNLSPNWTKDQALIRAIEDWVEYCLERKKNHFTKTVLSGLINKLNKSTIPDIVQAVETSISSGWIGLFPKPQTPQSAPKLSPHSGRSNNTAQDYSFSRTVRMDENGDMKEV